MGAFRFAMEVAHPRRTSVTMGIQRNVDTGPLPVWCGGAFCDLAGFEAPKDVLLRGKPISDQTNMNGLPAKL
jgi:hypothetical protein